MANEENVKTPSDVVAARVRQVRTRRGLTVADVADRCDALGAEHLTVQALYKLEGRRPGKRQRRPVTVDELLVLALALNVAPVHLLVSPDDNGAAYHITPKVTARRFGIRAWIRGLDPLDPDADRREFYTEVPGAEFPVPEFYMPAHTDPDGTYHSAIQQGALQQRGDDGGSN